MSKFEFRFDPSVSSGYSDKMLTEDLYIIEKIKQNSEEITSINITMSQMGDIDEKYFKDSFDNISRMMDLLKDALLNNSHIHKVEFWCWNDYYFKKNRTPVANIFNANYLG
jgi:Zn finger protein HypA/HybF involved in hydrogenase expression